MNDNAYRLADIPPGIHATQNITELRPFIESPERFKSRPKPPVPKPLLVRGRIEWEVEDIMETRIRANRREYKIKWKDSPGFTWEPRENLTNASRKLHQFEVTHGLCGSKPRSRTKDARTHLSPPPVMLREEAKPLPLTQKGDGPSTQVDQPWVPTLRSLL